MHKRIEKIENYNVFVFDDLINQKEIDSFFEFASNSNYGLYEKSYEKDKYRIFCKDFDPKKVEFNTPIGIKSRKILDCILQGKSKSYCLKRACLNLVKYGDIQFLHQDCSLNENDITVLYYVNNKWDYKWGGETIFSVNTDSLIAVLPKPGRFILFDGRVQHRGGMITKIAKQPRIVFALKYKLKQ